MKFEANEPFNFFELRTYHATHKYWRREDLKPPRKSLGSGEDN